MPSGPTSAGRLLMRDPSRLCRRICVCVNIKVYLLASIAALACDLLQLLDDAVLPLSFGIRSNSSLKQPPESGRATPDHLRSKQEIEQSGSSRCAKRSAIHTSVQSTADP